MIQLSAHEELSNAVDEKDAGIADLAAWSVRQEDTLLEWNAKAGESPVHRKRLLHGPPLGYSPVAEE